MCVFFHFIRNKYMIILFLGIGKHFHFGSQEDAHEFLCFTVDALQKACLNGSTK